MYAHAFEEQEKLVKYTELITNCIILDNTLEISAALNTLALEGYRPSLEEMAALSCRTHNCRIFAHRFSTFTPLLCESAQNATPDSNCGMWVPGIEML